MYKKAIAIIVSAIMALGVMTACDSPSKTESDDMSSTVSEESQPSVEESIEESSDDESSADTSSENEESKLA